ncbi:MAG TPA: DUF4252 domain-containing protein [Paludibacter sp.]
MKKIILLVAVLFMAVASQAQTLQSLFEKYSENENFEYVSVGGNGMTVASANGNVAKSKNAGPKKKSTKILTLKAGADSQIMKVFEKDLNAVLEAGKFETTLETRSKGASTFIYYRSLGDDNADQLIVAKTKTELSLIWESGKLGKGPMKYGTSSTANDDDLEDMDLGMH